MLETKTPKYDFSNVETIIEEIENENILNKTIVVKVNDVSFAIGMFFPDNSGKLGIICKLEDTDKPDFAKKLVQYNLHKKYNNWTNIKGSFPYSGNVGFQKDGDLLPYVTDQIHEIKPTITYCEEFISGKKTRTIHNVMVEELDNIDYSNYQDGLSEVCKMNFDLY